MNKYDKTSKLSDSVYREVIWFYLQTASIKDAAFEIGISKLEVQKAYKNLGGFLHDTFTIPIIRKQYPIFKKWFDLPNLSEEDELIDYYDIHRKILEFPDAEGAVDEARELRQQGIEPVEYIPVFEFLREISRNKRGLNESTFHLDLALAQFQAITEELFHETVGKERLMAQLKYLVGLLEKSPISQNPNVY